MIENNIESIVSEHTELKAVDASIKQATNEDAKLNDTNTLEKIAENEEGSTDNDSQSGLENLENHEIKDDHQNPTEEENYQEEEIHQVFQGRYMRREASLWSKMIFSYPKPLLDHAMENEICFE